MLNEVLTIEGHETLDKDFSTKDGCFMLFTIFLIFSGGVALFFLLIQKQIYYLIILSIPLILISFKLLGGFFTLQPNEAIVLVFYGTYKGTVKVSGFHWVNPFMSFTGISLRSKNLNGEIMKVNDKLGNPIQIAAAVIWRIHSTAKALFDVENYEYFVKVQYESAIRNIAFSYAYDKNNDNEISLRCGHEEVTKHLVKEMSARLYKAGIEVQEARITTLSYSSEIAGVMLKRQQAEAILSAREKIVQGAVSIVGHAINSLYEI